MPKGNNSSGPKNGKGNAGHASMGPSSSPSAHNTNSNINIVHSDSNWRQRIQSEVTAASKWRDSWGFLQTDDNTNNNTSRPQYNQLNSNEYDSDYLAENLFSENKKTNFDNQSLTLALTKISPTFPFLFKNYKRRQEEEKEKNLQNAGKSITNQNLQNKPGPLGPLAPLHLPGLHEAQGANNENLNNNNNNSIPPLYLDQQTARSLQPALLQPVGFCMATNGVSPRNKYRFPLASSHVLGWNSSKSLEFFGVAHHATSTLTTNRLYGQHGGQGQQAQGSASQNSFVKVPHPPHSVAPVPVSV